MYIYHHISIFSILRSEICPNPPYFRLQEAEQEAAHLADQLASLEQQKAKSVLARSSIRQQVGGWTNCPLKNGGFSNP